MILCALQTNSFWSQNVSLSPERLPLSPYFKYQDNALSLSLNPDFLSMENTHAHLKPRGIVIISSTEGYIARRTRFTTSFKRDFRPFLVVLRYSK